ncbi:universal stress protein [soil metagenome]
MRTLVGIDGQEHYRSALDLLSRLEFEDNRLTLVHVDPLVTDYGIYPVVPMVLNEVEIEEAITEAAKGLLKTASLAAKGSGLGDVETVYATGSSSATIMRMADERHDDLVAIGARPHGALESFFLGSVGRALAIGGHQSFLVARGVLKTHGPMRALFATDGSDYADRCFARLLAMDPRGIAHVSVVTAMESNKRYVIDARRSDVERAEEAAFGGSTQTATLSDVEDIERIKGDEMVRRLVASGRTADFRFVEGTPAAALGKAMIDTESDLMILGASGHGLISRVFIGSLALHVVVSESYPVLVMRMTEAGK